MIEDKLTPGQRARLECLAQAVAVAIAVAHSSGRTREDTVDQTLARAHQYFLFVTEEPTATGMISK
jgi:hypothetical protein